MNVGSKSSAPVFCSSIEAFGLSHRFLKVQLCRRHQWALLPSNRAFKAEI